MFITVRYDEEELEIIDATAVENDKGEKERPWCAATRVLEARENERQEREQEEQKKVSRLGQPEGRNASCGPSRLPPAGDRNGARRMYSHVVASSCFFLHQTNRNE